jgi:hypothetical protein
LPWSEHPAHALFTSVIERRDLLEWKALVENALRERKSRDVTASTHMAAVLEGIAHPVWVGTHEFMSKHPLGMYEEIILPLFRNYLLDLMPQADSRSKLKLARALTTQDRYELLRCLWQCEIGLTFDLDVQKHTRVWLSLNEAENVLDYPAAQRKLLAKGLTHIISQTRHFLTIWLNMTVPDKETVQAVRSALGDPLWQWLDYDLTELAKKDRGE